MDSQKARVSTNSPIKLAVSNERVMVEIFVKGLVANAEMEDLLIGKERCRTSQRRDAISEPKQMPSSSSSLQK